MIAPATDLDVNVVASRSALAHVLDVLVDNALRHGIGQVSVSCEQAGPGVVLRVEDEGAIDLSALGKAFEPPRVVEALAASPSRGGIGLGFARRLARGEGGDVSCTSASPTTFSVVLDTI